MYVLQPGNGAGLRGYCGADSRSVSNGLINMDSDAHKEKVKDIHAL